MLHFCTFEMWHTKNYCTGLVSETQWDEVWGHGNNNSFLMWPVTEPVSHTLDVLPLPTLPSLHSICGFRAGTQIIGISTNLIFIFILKAFIYGGPPSQDYCRMFYRIFKGYDWLVQIDRFNCYPLHGVRDAMCWMLCSLWSEI